MQVIFKSLVFASEKHKKQKRLDKQGTPYINHPIGVANLLVESGITDEVIIQGAILHDTIEDTATTYKELVENFGQEVADVVMEVSDDGKLPKMERKRLQIENAKNLTVKAKHIRLADKLYNLTDICRCVPIGWTVARVQEYFVWAKNVIDGCSNTNAQIEDKLTHLFKTATFTLGNQSYPCLP
ncbi:hypothetical protein K502DRAFT_316832 [Neoconidiobolus thromboides FSU 785]|nr:hypothetical protein K502DRAFT_316832 [Neoconidiobolus thromboides FSU 785]